MKQYFYRGALLLILSHFIYLQSHGQKLPDLQNRSILAPENLKIDGNINEWGDQLQAFNKAQFIFYTIANNNEYLFIIIRSENTLITSKILSGGIKITVNTGRKKEKGGVAIIYPLVGQSEITAINRSMPAAVSDVMSKKDQDEALKNRETAIAKANSKNIDMYKTIRVSGIQDIDSLISIYNEENIKVRLKTDSRNALNYELAIPLKYLGITNNNAPFYYNIKLLGKVVPAGVVINPIVSQNGGPPLGPGGVDRRSMIVDTDFWGEYTLAKKP